MELVVDHDISLEQCWAWLRETSVGRLALSVSALPTIVPVQYGVSDRGLVLCLGPHRLDPRAVDGAVVAFTTDAIDPVSLTGWSVLVRGIARLDPEIGVDPTCRPSPAGRLVELAATVIEGQRLKMCPFSV